MEKNNISSHKTEIKNNSDKFMNYFLFIFYAFGLFLAFFYDTWFVAISVGGLALAAYYLSKFLLKESNFYQYVLGVIFGIFMAQFIYQMHGLFEMHFFAFIGSAILISYQNWRLQIPLAIFVVVHHGLFAYLQFSGNEDIYFTQLDYMTLNTFLFHGALASLMFFINGFWAYKNERNFQNFIESENEKQSLAKLDQSKTSAIKDLEERETQLNISLDEIRQLKNALDQAAIVAITDNKGIIKQVNPKFIEISKYSEGELIGQDHRILNSGHHPKEFFIDLWKTIAKGEIWKGVVKNKAKDNSFYWVDTTIVPFFDENGKVNEFVAIRHDVTSQVNLLEDISKLTSFQSSILRGTSHGIITTNKEGIITSFNKGAEKLLGYSEAELLNKESPAIFHDLNEVVKRAEVLSKEFGKEIAPGFDVFIYKAKEHGVADENEWTYISKEGFRIPIWLSITALKDSLGEIYGYLGIASDNTEQKEHIKAIEGINLELEIKEQQISNTMSAINNSNASIEFDLNGNIIEVNDIFCKLMGYKKEELLHKHHSIFVEPGYEKTEEYAAFWQKLGKGEFISGEFKRYGKNRNEIWISGSYNPIKDNNGKVYKFLKICQDLSKTILQQQELERKNKELDQFSYVVSHDLKAPLRAISTLSDFIMEDDADKLSTDSQSNLNLIKNRTARMQALIDDILNYSKIGRENIPITEFNIGEIAKEIVGDLNVPDEIKIIISPELPNVKSELIYWKQILGNLISNAIKYNDKEQGEITIDFKKSQKEFIISVADNGPGIEKQYFKKIFQIFQTIEKTIKPDSTGVGLSTVSKIMEEMKGKIEVESEVGKGTVFSVIFPINKLS